MTRDYLNKAIMERLPIYYQFLKSLSLEDNPYISATTIARELNFGEVQVRKDLALISGTGKPKVGYETSNLIKDLHYALGYDQVVNAILVGVGQLGSALLNYVGFKDYSINIAAAFDKNEAKAGVTKTGKRILPLTTLKEFCLKNNIEIGIITVPQDHAQEICDMMVDSGIKAIWNFAPKRVTAPENILIKNENMAASLAMLSGHLRNLKNE